MPEDAGISFGILAVLAAGAFLYARLRGRHSSRTEALLREARVARYKGGVGGSGGEWRDTRRSRLSQEEQAIARRRSSGAPLSGAPGGAVELTTINFRGMSDAVHVDAGMLQSEVDREAAALLARLHQQAAADESADDGRAVDGAAVAAPANMAADTSPPPTYGAVGSPPAHSPDLRKGDVVEYEHRQFGRIIVEIVGVDHEGTHDGGVTYVIAAPEIQGVVETTRSRLRTRMEVNAMG